MKNNIRKEFGQRVRELRNKLDISQEELADRAGVHRTYIGAVERGEKNISIDNIKKIADALKVKISNLFYE